MPPTSVDRPIFWIIAGPNGSGKTSFYSKADIEDFGRSIWIINPDLLAARIAARENVALEAANRTAVERIYEWLAASICAYQTIGVETVLSTNKYQRLVTEAKKRSFDVRLIYVLLDNPERNVERVRRRVREGGHAVPEDKIRTRYWRSLDQLPWFPAQADRAFIFDNSSDVPRQIAIKQDGAITVDTSALLVIKQAAEKAAAMP